VVAPALLDFEAHGDGIGAAWTVLSDHALRAGPDAAVANCPDWRMRDLLAHQGTVHRWATAILRGQRVDTEELEREGLAAADQRAWLDAGAKDLLQALVDAPDDLDGSFFLADPPPPKFAWARRQCHETTIHAVDAMSASLGRPPRANETWVRPELAADGVDELLTGFVPRPRQRLRSVEPLTVVVETTDTGHAWTMQVGPDPVVTTRERAPAPDALLAGPAVQVYLGLWNRGDEWEVSDPSFLARWREQTRIVWA
jgi:uncharacterized protein (TIGR03083 family)